MAEIFICPRCRSGYISEDFGMNRLGARFKTCRKCRETQKTNSTLTIDDVHNFASDSPFVCISDRFIDMKKPLEWQCTECATEWTNSLFSMKYQNTQCPMCSIAKLNMEITITCLDTTYKKVTDHLRWKCDECFWEWTGCLATVKHRGSGCPKCAKKSVRFTIEDVYRFVEHESLTCVSTEYKSINKHLEWRCDKCSLEWKATFLAVKHCHTRCPVCSRKAVPND
jgi:hypothetical protein